MNTLLNKNIEDENKIYNNELIEKLIKKDINEIFDKWNLINDDYKTCIRQPYESKSIGKISIIKNSIKENIGYVGAHIFINDYFSKHLYKGPYSHIDKALFVIYDLIFNIKKDNVNDYITNCSYYNIKKELYDIQNVIFTNWINKKLLTFFSSGNLRFDRTYNNYNDSTDINGITLTLHVYDNNIKSNNSFLTPIIIDRKGFIIWVGESVKKKYDEIDNINLENIMTKYDCIFINANSKIADKIIDNNLKKFKIENFRVFEYDNNTMIDNINNKLIMDININTIKQIKQFKKLNVYFKNIKIYNIMLRFCCLLLNFKNSENYIYKKYNKSYEYWFTEGSILKFIENSTHSIEDINYFTKGIICPAVPKYKHNVIFENNIKNIRDEFLKLRLSNLDNNTN